MIDVCDVHAPLCGQFQRSLDALPEADKDSVAIFDPRVKHNFIQSFNRCPLSPVVRGDYEARAEQLVLLAQVRIPGSSILGLDQE